MLCATHLLINGTSRDQEGVIIHRSGGVLRAPHPAEDQSEPSRGTLCQAFKADSTLTDVLTTPFTILGRALPERPVKR